MMYAFLCRLPVQFNGTHLARPGTLSVQMRAFRIFFDLSSRLPQRARGGCSTAENHHRSEFSVHCEASEAAVTGTAHDVYKVYFLKALGMTGCLQSWTSRTSVLRAGALHSIQRLARMQRQCATFISKPNTSGALNGSDLGLSQLPPGCERQNKMTLPCRTRGSRP